MTTEKIKHLELEEPFVLISKLPNGNHVLTWKPPPSDLYWTEGYAENKAVMIMNALAPHLARQQHNAMVEKMAKHRSEKDQRHEKLLATLCEEGLIFEEYVFNPQRWSLSARAQTMLHEWANRTDRGRIPQPLSLQEAEVVGAASVSPTPSFGGNPLSEKAFCDDINDYCER